MLEETLAGASGANATGKVEKPPVEDESTRLRRLLDAQIAERNASSRPQPGGGASGGLTIPEETAEPGKPVVTKLAEKGKCCQI